MRADVGQLMWFAGSRGFGELQSPRLADLVPLRPRSNRPVESTRLNARGRRATCFARLSNTNNNQLTGVTHSNGSFTNESFTWDNNGNETGTGYTTGTDNEQTASPGYTYTYDNAGEMTSETQTSTGDVWAYGYDFRGRMVTAAEKTSGGTTLESVTFTYDALGNRIGMDENSTQTWTLYDSGNPIMDFNSSGSLTMRYLWGPTGIVARQTSGGTVSWYLADHLGTVRDLINNSGAIIDHVDFSAFGTVLDESSPTSGDRMMGFAGMERDTATELNLAVFREENPGTGRWDSQDPLGFVAGDSDLYRFVNNVPSSNGDPTGLLADDEPVRMDGRKQNPAPATPRPTKPAKRPLTQKPARQSDSTGATKPAKRIPTPPNTDGGYGDYWIPGYLQVSPDFKPSGGQFFWIPEYDYNDPSNPFELPTPGTTNNYTDAIQTPAGVLKIPGGTTVILIGCTADGRPIFYSDGDTEWYPAEGGAPGGGNPFGDNPSTPQTEPFYGGKPAQTIGPHPAPRRSRP